MTSFKTNSALFLVCLIYLSIFPNESIADSERWTFDRISQLSIEDRLAFDLAYGRYNWRPEYSREEDFKRDVIRVASSQYKKQYFSMNSFQRRSFLKGLYNKIKNKAESLPEILEISITIATSLSKDYIFSRESKYRLRGMGYYTSCIPRFFLASTEEKQNISGIKIGISWPPLLSSFGITCRSSNTREIWSTRIFMPSDELAEKFFNPTGVLNITSKCVIAKYLRTVKNEIRCWINAPIVIQGKESLTLRSHGWSYAYGESNLVDLNLSSFSEIADLATNEKYAEIFDRMDKSEIDNFNFRKEDANKGLDMLFFSEDAKNKIEVCIHGADGRGQYPICGDFLR